MNRYSGGMMGILISNDDGISSIGIQSLEKSLKDIDTIFVSAPNKQQSGKSHSITVNGSIKTESLGEDKYAIDGSPADCVKTAIKVLFKDRINLVVSGINDGFNVANDIYYSGTVAAAREAVLNGIHAIAFSLEYGGNETDFINAANIAKDMVEKIYKTLDIATFQACPLFLNINIPKKKPKGIVFTEVGKLSYDEEYEIKEQGNNIKDITCRFIKTEGDEKDNSDYYVTKSGYISITSLKIDLPKSEIYNDNLLKKVLL